jgi:hypothetical protein
MSQITINVPDELQDQIDDWTNGQDYEITVTQTGPNMFDLKSIDGSGESDEDTDESDEMKPGSMNDNTGTTIPSTNPAVVGLIMAKNKGSAGK